MGFSIEPSHERSAIWAARLRDFLHECVSSATSEEEDRIREAALLLARMGGKDFRRVDPLAIEAMLASGAGESAVLELVGPQVPFIVSRGGNGRCLASLVMSDGVEEVLAEGASLALAMLAAYAAFLLQDMQQDEAHGGMRAMEAASRLH